MAKGFCEICGTEIEVKLCCSGRECSCMGLPIEPPVCSQECYDIYENRNEGKCDNHHCVDGYVGQLYGEKLVCGVCNGTGYIQD